MGAVIRAYLDGVDVSSLVRLDPQLLDDLVDLIHLGIVETHDGSVQGLVVLTKVLTSRLCSLERKRGGF